MASLSYSLRLYVESCLRTVERSARERIQETDCVHSLLYINPSDSSCNVFLSFLHHFRMLIHCIALPHMILLAMPRSSLHCVRIFIHCIAPREPSYNFSLVFLSVSHFHSLHCPMACFRQLPCRRFVIFRVPRMAAAHSDILIRLRLSNLFSRLSNRLATCLATDKCTIAAPQDV